MIKLLSLKLDNTGNRNLLFSMECGRILARPCTYFLAWNSDMPLFTQSTFYAKLVTVVKKIQCVWEGS